MGINDGRSSAVAFLAGCGLATVRGTNSHRPLTALHDELYSDACSAAGERPPIDHPCPRPEVAADRFKQNKTSRFPNPLRGHASAMGTNVMRCSRLRAPAAAKVRKLYRFRQNSPHFSSDASAGHTGHLIEWGHSTPSFLSRIIG